MKTLRDYIDLVNESFNSMMDLERNASLEKRINQIADRAGISNVKALSTWSPESHFVTFNYDGALEVHILGPNMTPYFTKNNPAPMRVFSTAINLIKQHAESGGLVRIECSPEKEAVDFYKLFANRAEKLGYDVEFIPKYMGSSGVMVSAYEISKPTNKENPNDTE